MRPHLGCGLSRCARGDYDLAASAANHGATFSQSDTNRTRKNAGKRGLVSMTIGSRESGKWAGTELSLLSFYDLKCLDCVLFGKTAGADGSEACECSPPGFTRSKFRFTTPATPLRHSNRRGFGRMSPKGKFDACPTPKVSRSGTNVIGIVQRIPNSFQGIPKPNQWVSNRAPMVWC